MFCATTSFSEPKVGTNFVTPGSNPFIISAKPSILLYFSLSEKTSANFNISFLPSTFSFPILDIHSRNISFSVSSKC